MRIKSLAFVLSIFILSCSNNKNVNENESDKQTTIKLTDKKSSDNSKEFLQEFAELDFQNLHVYSRNNDLEGDPNNTIYKGKILNVNKYNFFSNKQYFENLDFYKDGSYNMYKIGKFNFNHDYIGLIIRQKSEYDESLIQLILWNKIKNQIEYVLDLSDSWGDVDFRFIKESWIIKDEKMKTIKIIVRKKEGQIIDESGMEIIADSLYTFIFDSGKLTKYKSELYNKSDYEFKLKWK